MKQASDVCLDSPEFWLNVQPRGRWRIRQLEGITAFGSQDPGSSRIWWTDAGVRQDLTFPVQPDPVSGMKPRAPQGQNRAED